MNTGISVIICCYNSEKKIEQTLLHLAKQSPQPTTSAEVVLVDNNSTDQTVAIAKAIWDRVNVPMPLVVVYEPIAGLSNARKAGIEHSQYDYIIFCDDDNWLDENYLETVIGYFNNDPSIAIIGGTGQAVFEHQKPWWFDRFCHGYAVGKQLPEEGYLNSVYGAGMAIRKDVLISKSFNALPLLLSDRKGTELSSGGDSEICLRIRLLGYKILYSEKLGFKHFLTDNRLTWPYLKKLHLGFAHASIFLGLYERALNNNRPLHRFYWLNKSIFYFGRSIKYALLHLGLVLGKNEGRIEIVNLNTWWLLAGRYLKYNFQVNKKYKLILKIKQQI